MSGYTKNERGTWVPLASAHLWRSRAVDGDDTDTGVAEVEDVDDAGFRYRRRVFIMPAHLRPQQNALGPASRRYLVVESEKLNAQLTEERAMSRSSLYY